MKTLIKIITITLAFANSIETNGQVDVLPNGNVGIDNLNPQYKLDVNGSINFTDSLYMNGVPFSIDGGESYWIYDNDTGKVKSAQDIAVEGDIYFTGQLYQNGLPVSFDHPWEVNDLLGNLFVQNKVAIGKSVADYDLDVVGDINFTGELMKNGEPVEFGGGSESLWSGDTSSVSYVGKVGIGTHNPTTKLEVLGAVKISNTIRLYVDPTKPDNSGDGLSAEGAKRTLGAVLNLANSLTATNVHVTFVNASSTQPVTIGEVFTLKDKFVSIEINSTGTSEADANLVWDISDNHLYNSQLYMSGYYTTIKVTSKTMFYVVYGENLLTAYYQGNIYFSQPASNVLRYYTYGNLDLHNVIISTTGKGDVSLDGGYPWQNLKYSGFLPSKSAPKDGVTYGKKIFFEKAFTTLASGEVGIGTTNPVHSLDVSGNINFTGELLQNGQPLELEESPLWDTRNNIAIGANTLSNIGAQSHNIAIGQYALENNVQNYNIGIGYTALRDNTTGYLNLAIGFASLQNNTTASGNVAVGYNTLNRATTGGSNTALGYNALAYNVGGSANVGIGYNAGLANANGHYNVAIGQSALQTSKSGNANTAIGFQNLLYADGVSNNTSIGWRALFNNRKSHSNTAVGYQSLYDYNPTNAIHGFNTTLGYNTARGIITGTGNTILGSNVTALPAAMTNNIVIADGTGKRRINVNASGNVGISVNDANHPLQLASGAHVTAGGVWTNASDISKKKNVKDLEYGMEELMQLAPKSYIYKTDNSRSIGFIAQEIEKIIPEVVSGEEGDKGVAYGIITSLLVKVVQDQQEEIKILKEGLNQLLNRLENNFVSKNE